MNCMDIYMKSGVIAYYKMNVNFILKFMNPRYWILNKIHYILKYGKILNLLHYWLELKKVPIWLFIYITSRKFDKKTANINNKI